MVSKKVWGDWHHGVILIFVYEASQGEQDVRDGEPVKSLVFTIGHSSHSAEKFVSLLKMHGIEMVVDVRSHPYSRHAPHFKARVLEASLSENGIGYLFLGGELGGRPESREFYDARGRVDYGLLSRSPTFREGVSKLEAEIESHMVALLCSEENPARCHRRLLVGRSLEERGITVRHIRGDGSIQSEHDVDGGHPVLFPETEASPRKSIRSASPRRPRPNSSGR